MTKTEFLNELDSRLSTMPPEVRFRAFEYYSEMIEDGIEDGLTEEEAVARIGTPEEAAESVKTEARDRVDVYVHEVADRVIEKYTYPTGGFKNITVLDSCCHVFIELGRRRDCEIVYTDTANLTHTVSVDGDTLTIRCRDGRRLFERAQLRLKRLKVTIRLPETKYGILRVENSSGDITVHRELSFNEAKLMTRSGDIRFDGEVENKLAIDTISGDVHMKTARANELDAVSVSGDFGIESSSFAYVKAGSKSGDVVFKACRIGEADANSASGDVAFVTTQCEGRLTAEASSGDVKLNQCDAKEYYLKSVSGDIECVIMHPKTYSVGTVSGSIRVPQVNGSDTLSALTVSGDIVVKLYGE